MIFQKREQHDPTQPTPLVYPWRFYGHDKTLKRRFQTSFYSVYPCRFWGKEGLHFSIVLRE